MLNASLFTRGIAIVFALASASAGAQAVRVQPVAQALDHPWAVAFLPQGRFLVTERAGRLRRVDAQGNLSAPLLGLPAIASGGQGGLLACAQLLAPRLVIDQRRVARFHRARKPQV